MSAAVELKLLCKLLLQNRFVSEDVLAQALRSPASSRGKLLEVLLKRGALTAEQVELIRRDAAAATGASGAATGSSGAAGASSTQIPSLATLDPPQRSNVVQLRLAEDPALGLDLDAVTPEPRSGIPLSLAIPDLEAVPPATPASVADVPVASVADVPVASVADVPVASVADVPVASATDAPSPPATFAPSSPASVAPSPPVILAPLPPLEIAPPSVAATPPAPSADTQWLHTLLADGMRRGASDVHLHAALAPMIRLDGALAPLEGHAALAAADTERLARAALTDAQSAQLAADHDIAFVYTAPALGRFRARIYHQQRGVDLVFRVIPTDVASLKSLGLPESLAKVAALRHGLVLCTGPAGSGKSTTLAALVDLINRERAGHILTIEDPIEVIHPSRRCLVRQRQVGSHTASFACALRAALREDPDVIVVGELRCRETIALALAAAESGRLVLATVSTGNALGTINRLVDVFPPSLQAQMRALVAASLRAIVSQRLVRRADGAGRVPALELLTVIPAVANLIREEHQQQIRPLMQTGRALGMRLLDESLKELVASGMITMQEARAAADLPGAFG